MGFGGGGFFGSGADQSENNSSQGSAGAQSQSGSPLAVNLSAGDDIKGVDLNTTLNVSTTDFGAIEAAYGVAEKAFQFGSDALLETMSGVSQVTNNAVNLAADSVLSQERLAGLAIDGNTKLAYDSIAAMVAAQDSNNKLIGDVYGENISFLDSVNNKFFDTGAALTAEALNAHTQNLEILQFATENAMDKVFQASQSDAERVTENFTKYALGAVVVIIALVLFSGVAKG